MSGESARSGGVESGAARALGAACLGLALLACGAGEGADAGPSAGADRRGNGGPPAAAPQEAGSEAEPGVAAARPAADGTIRITVGGHPVTVEVADEDAERSRGLMDRESLPEDHGMLFVYDAERHLSFWMRNTLIPLDVAFIDASGRIVDIQSMEPMTDETHTSRVPALYALEMNRGWFEEHGVDVGDMVEF